MPRAIPLVEDEEVVGDALEEILTSSGYATLRATDGAAALELVRRERPVPSVVLLDLHMPGIDGWRFLSAVRDDPALAQLRVVVTTGDDESPPTGRPSLRKPIQSGELLDLLKRLCGGPSLTVRSDPYLLVH